MYTNYRFTVALTVNCGYARTAIRELSSTQWGSSRKHIDKAQRMQRFREMFDMPSLGLTEELFTANNERDAAPFERYCNTILSQFSNKWHPTAKHRVYRHLFDITMDGIA